jgi:hypothetical protein
MDALHVVHEQALEHPISIADQNKCLVAFDFVKESLGGRGGGSSCGCKVRIAPYGQAGVPVHHMCRENLLRLAPSVQVVAQSATAMYVT